MLRMSASILFLTRTNLILPKPTEWAVSGKCNGKLSDPVFHNPGARVCSF